MEYRHWFAIIALPAFALFLYACAGHQLVTRQQPGTGLSSYRSVVLYFEPTDQNIQQELAELQARTRATLDRMSIGPKVRFGAPETAGAGDVVARVSVVGIRRVDGGTRAMLGAFAGRASLDVQIKVMDATNGSLIGDYVVTGESGYIGGETKHATRKTAEGIAACLGQAE